MKRGRLHWPFFFVIIPDMSLFTDDKPELPARAGVSILERVVPAVSFGLASISGVIGP